MTGNILCILHRHTRSGGGGDPGHNGKPTIKLPVGGVARRGLQTTGQHQLLLVILVTSLQLGVLAYYLQIDRVSFVFFYFVFCILAFTIFKSHVQLNRKKYMTNITF